MSNDNGQKMVAAAQPLERVMFLFNQPPGWSSADMRRKAGVVFAVSVVLVSIVFGITPTLMRMSGPISQMGFFVILMVYGTGFLLLPASLFRIIYGVTDPNDGFGYKLVRGFVAFVLFLFTSFASCMIYGQITR